MCLMEGYMLNMSISYAGRVKPEYKSPIQPNSGNVNYVTQAAH